MYYDSIGKYRKQIILGVVLLFVVIVAWAVLTFIGRQGKVAVFVSTVPRDAKVQFDDSIKGSGTQWLNPGVYTVHAKKDGFSSVTRKVTVTNKKSQNVVAMSLQPESDRAKEWADKNIDLYRKNETYGTIEANTNGEYFRNTHPITTKLPFTDPYFKIAYKTNSDQSIIITISTPSPRYRFYAIEKIREFGYDPTDFTIEFIQFKNPLGETK